MMKAYDLDRFIKAQEQDYETVLKEIRQGRKKSHWIWYSFPQIADLGLSSINSNELYIAEMNESITACMVVNHKYNDGYKDIQWSVDAEDSELLVVHAFRFMVSIGDAQNPDGGRSSVIWFL